MLASVVSGTWSSARFQQIARAVPDSVETNERRVPGRRGRPRTATTAGSFRAGVDPDILTGWRTAPARTSISTATMTQAEPKGTGRSDIDARRVHADARLAGGHARRTPAVGVTPWLGPPAGRRLSAAASRLRSTKIVEPAGRRRMRRAASAMSETRQSIVQRPVQEATQAMQPGGARPGHGTGGSTARADPAPEAIENSMGTKSTGRDGVGGAVF
ncbi:MULTISPECIES: hypothetical protein [Actinoalloteichus]|uniref:Uncharacterized protein n=1 Tax=Actinoalloteichus fjordicus TaxID=1612552 RepID=A0AAC9PTQ8_9PSEU|nr:MULTISPECIES: hypothetical protein [Actinoalloteichus]APU16297.1 hypothetical protein UA74_21360 [Actinoalloteichus fjordicus]APU22357.1 hypothetical protein UA75_21840 [Actinoalloteichus sp. GBA129-24]